MQSEVEGFTRRHNEFLKKIRVDVEQKSFQDDLSSLFKVVSKDLQPDLTLLLDAPVGLGLERAKKRSKPDRFEQEQQDFFTRVRDEYLERAKRYPDRYRLVDASQNLDDVSADIEVILKEFLS